MQIEYDIPTILAYYGASADSASCVSYLLDTNEPIDAELLSKNRPLYCLFTMKPSALQRRLPFSEVMRRSYGWPDTVCVCESHSPDTSQRTGLFLVGREDTAVLLGMYPRYAYSMAFFACDATLPQLSNTFDVDAELLLSNPPALYDAATRINAELIHCINGWDGYSVNCIRQEL